MPVVAEPTWELTPRIEMSAWVPKPLGLSSIPGVRRVMSPMLLMPRASRAFWFSAVMLCATLLIAVAWRVAVTTISPTVVLSPGLASAARAATGAVPHSSTAVSTPRFHSVALRVERACAIRIPHLPGAHASILKYCRQV